MRNRRAFPFSEFLSGASSSLSRPFSKSDYGRNKQQLFRKAPNWSSVLIQNSTPTSRSLLQMLLNQPAEAHCPAELMQCKSHCVKMPLVRDHEQDQHWYAPNIDPPQVSVNDNPNSTAIQTVGGARRGLVTSGIGERDQTGASAS